MFKNALVSVSDKSGLEEFLRPLVEQGMKIVSSGGTAQFLKDKGFEVTKVSDQTRFPEVMGGRVKTLHPYIHMPILQRSWVEEDQQILKEHGLEPFDLVVVNLYPFKQALEKDLSEEEMVEFIDIGGPTLLRAAAKNFASLSVVCDPNDYSEIAKKTKLELADRKALSAKVFKHVSDYDSHIANFLSGDQTSTEMSLTGELHKELRYGENPQQQGLWYKSQSQGLHQATILQGKELSYNNILDIEAAVQALHLFDGPSVVSVKHNNPCGVATAGNLSLALSQSLKADPMSVFGGIIALNEPIDADCAKQLTSLFLECIVAPDITDSAREILAAKKNLRVLVWKDLLNKNIKQNQLRTVSGGFVSQSQDKVELNSSEWKVVSGELSEADWQGLQFAWRVCACLKSNAIAVTSVNQSLGLGMGQVNRVDAVKQAFARAKDFHPQEKELYLASDAFFPFADSIEQAASHGVKAIIQPGGSVKDQDVISKAKELNVPMVFTSRRHFKH